jgi:ATP-dependent Clp protease ATP-binding subunit ClpC
MRRLQLQDDFERAKLEWQQENTIDEVVSAEDIAGVVAQWTGIPTNQVLETESEKLLRMEEAIHERIIGQEGAVTAIAHAIRRARSGLKDPRRPIGSFIFLGSSGVGKTELAKALAEFMFDDEDALVRIDMSEYHEQHTVSRLFGAPPGYVGYEEGGQLTEAVRRRPYRVILFDEIEKAHPDIWNALLQILEDGRLTDGQGRTVDFSNTVIIMTSNLGTEFAKRGGALGFVQPTDEQAIADHQKIEKAMREAFRPEFLNRIDEIIIFEPLTLAQVEQIVDLQLREIAERLAERGLVIHLTEPARRWLSQKGWDPSFGARPLRRALQRYVENELSAQLLRGGFRSGDLIVIDEVNNQLTFERHENASSDYLNLRQKNYID